VQEQRRQEAAVEGRPLRRPTSVRVRLAVLALLLGAGLAVAVRSPLPDRAELLAWPAEHGGWAIALFAALYLAAALAPVPKGPLSAAAGLVFGLPAGALVVWAAALTGAGAAFWLGRLLGREAVERLARGGVQRVDAFVARYGTWAVLALRLVPLVPFTALNYGSGLTALRFRGYLVATAVGIVPGVLAYVALGAYGTAPTSAPFVVAVLALLALSAGGALIARRTARGGR
jgi:uncharacterized membrane protein YdjX (TVP38/TMEM64 family)